MIYIEKATVNKPHYFLKVGASITFQEDITLLVGDQGCGKSSFLRLLGDNRDLDVQLSDLCKEKGAKTFYFDFENDNPRVKNPELFTKPNGESVGIGYGGALASRFRSHGQILLNYSVEGLKQAEECIIFFDEPESALSVRSQYKMINEIHRCVNDRSCQVVIATHCLPLIESVQNVYSMEHNEWMSSLEFLKTQQDEQVH